MSDEKQTSAAVSVVEIGTANLPKHPHTQELLSRALAGDLPRGRPLKPWEPEKLNPTSLQVVLLRASGMKQRDIAEFMNLTQGTKMTDSHVSIIVNHPDARTILTQLISYAADEVADLRTRIQAYAGEGLDAAVNIMRTNNDKRLVAKIAFEFLDRAGYNTVQKSISATTIVAPKGSVEGLAQAIAESAQEVHADYVVEPHTVLEGEGSGNPLAVSESLASGQVADEPPVGASPSLPKITNKDLEPEDVELLRKIA